jgi:hypothetical protein
MAANLASALSSWLANMSLWVQRLRSHDRAIDDGHGVRDAEADEREQRPLNGPGYATTVAQSRGDLSASREAVPVVRMRIPPVSHVASE